MGVTSVVGVPIDCTGRFAGCERAPKSYRDAGLVAALGLPDLGDLPVTLDDPERDVTTGIIGYEGVVRASQVIRKELGQLLRTGERPLLLGGDCTLLIGAAAALRDVYRRAGLAFVDGHIDFYDGPSSPTGEAADMELAVVTGTGPSQLTALSGSAPLVFPGDVAAVGVRDLEDARANGAPDPHPAMRIYAYDPAQRDADLADIGRSVAARFAADPGRFWLHLDFDVLSVDAMPAVDYRMPGGMTWEGLHHVCRPLAISPALLGIDVTIYNPTLDTDGKGAERIVRFLSDLFA